MRTELFMKVTSKTHEVVYRSGSLELVAVDILGPLLKMYTGNHFIVVIMDRYYKLKRAVFMTKDVVPKVASIYSEHLVITYIISTFPWRIKAFKS